MRILATFCCVTIYNNDAAALHNPYMGAALAEKFEITTDVRYFVVAKQLIFYRVDEENSTIEILRVLDGRTDYLSVLFG